MDSLVINLWKSKVDLNIIFSTSFGSLNVLCHIWEWYISILIFIFLLLLRAGYFLTQIFHPNIATNGEICVNVLKKDWNQSLGLRDVLIVSSFNLLFVSSKLSVTLILVSKCWILTSFLRFVTFFFGHRTYKTHLVDTLFNFDRSYDAYWSNHFLNQL